MIDLARELAAHGRFAWRPGMGTWDGGVVVAADSEEDCHTVWTRGRLESCVTSSYLGAPHLNASGTIGGLLKMLWEIDHKAHTYCNAGRLVRDLRGR